MDRLIEGHKRFLAEVFPVRRDQFHLLAEMQAPEWLFITCSDSRVQPDLFLGTGPGDLFITRNAGNVVPVTSQDVDGVTATIEYAVEVLKVKSAILCGHSDCGALKVALDRAALEDLPKARRWLEHVEAAFAHRQPLNPADGERKCGVGIADSRQRGGAMDEPAGAAFRGACSCRGPADGPRVVLRHFERAD
jgi:carbonic anhydrase